MAVVHAVVRAGQLTAVFPLEASEAHALAVHAVSTSHAVFGTSLDAAVISGISFVA